MSLEELAVFCKKHRITRIKTSDYEIEFELPPTEEQIKASNEVADMMAKAKRVTDEDILMNPMAGLEDIDAD